MSGDVVGDIEVVEIPGGTVVELAYEPDDPLAGATVIAVATDADGEPPPPAAGLFVHVQATPAASWVIAHGLRRFPQVTVVDTSGHRVLTDVAYGDQNTVTVTNYGPFAGTAYLA